MKNFNSIIISSGNRKIDLTVVERIMRTIIERKNLKITNIAISTKLNYTRCVRYIRLLSNYGLIVITPDGISVSQQGIELLDLIQNMKKYFSKTN